jgi:DNA (cytosine-5)-methyltransferase 1
VHQVTLIDMSMHPYTVAGLFAGIGGIETGFSLAGFNPVIANELDPYASETYRENYAHPLVEADIADFDASLLPKDLTVLAGGFPCQPFSVAGYRKGFNDDRGNVYWEIDRLFNATKPDVVFLENVKNLVGHDSGNTFRVIKASLEDAGYFVTAEVLNSKTHGNIPQNRERIYIIAFKSEASYRAFSWPTEIPLTTKLSALIDFNRKVDDRYYYTSERPFYSDLVASITKKNTIYQWRRRYVRENMSGVSPTLTANMGMGGHNVPLILSKHGIRKLTPQECFRLMGFDDLRTPAGMSESRLYKQAGNAVVVPVVQRIAVEIRRALDVSTLDGIGEETSMQEVLAPRVKDPIPTL